MTSGGMNDEIDQGILCAKETSDATQMGPTTSYPYLLLGSQQC